MFALQLFQPVINAFDMPTRQSLLVDLIEDRGDLSNAVALNSSMVNGARLIGPSIAGPVGAPLALVGGGVICALGAALFGHKLPGLREKARPVHVEKNIVPGVTETVREATTLREEVEQ